MFLKKIIFLTLIFTISIFAQEKYLNHKISAEVLPNKSFIKVTDKITFENNVKNLETTFELNSALKITDVIGGTIENIGSNISTEDIGMDRDKHQQIQISTYKLRIPDAIQITLHYEGIINSPFEQSEENYQRGFSESPGIISEVGIYLAGSTYWIPNFEEKLFTFELTTKLPNEWLSISQGERISIKNNLAVWNSPEPQEEVFLIGAKFVEYSKDVGAVKAMAFLRTKDDALAAKYLDVTAQYLEMYRNLIGIFPYKKFALVENFWETGYGMPSFTLLGEKIIRFPFILHSSYPHELLHNWWGNSVYVNFEKGNWCEGITAYMADHLIKEQRGQGAEHRRAILQRFTDYVNEENDFPPIEFLSRFDGASEAIGYGKTAMLWHMLRREVGDDNFQKAFQQFNRDFKYKFATFTDIQNTFKKVSEIDVDYLFDEMLNRTGAAELQLVKSNYSDGKLLITLQQNQKENVFKLNIPLAIYFADEVITKKVMMTKKLQTFDFNFEKSPIKIEVDHEFDIFRKLNINEIPPSLSKAFGSKDLLIVVPSSENETDYSEIAESWAKNKNAQIIKDSELENLPTDKTIWLFGNSNKFLEKLKAQFLNSKISIEKNSISLFDKTYPKENHSFVVALKNPNKPDNVIIWSSTTNQSAIAGLIRKLPHYGKYSYLVFEGDEPANVGKGEFPSFDSPLVSILDSKIISNATLPKRKALAYLKPVFSEKNMMKDISELASEKMKGRGLKTDGIYLASEYLKKQFEDIGLEKGNGDSYFQEWKQTIKGSEFELKNIVGFIPGTNDSLKYSPLIISAHYDHLGFGFPDVYKGNEGKLHAGADDNASGIAVMLELARSLMDAKPLRPIYFVAFSAEESGLIGSKHFIDNLPNTINKNEIIANLNFDTVGRLFKNKLIIINSETAREWRFIFMGTDYVTGIPTELIKEKLDASDQVSFINAGIPAIQFFSGANKDYHKPTDTIEKIDKSGLVKVATVGKEVAQYLANRIEPLTYISQEKDKTNHVKSGHPGGQATSSGNTTRRVKTGVVPDFTFADGGVKISDIYEDSAAEMVDLQIGDIIIKINDIKISGLREYSNELKKYSPGQKIKLTILRNGNEIVKKLILEEK